VLAFYLMALTWQETLKDILINSPSLADTYAQVSDLIEAEKLISLEEGICHEDDQADVPAGFLIFTEDDGEYA
jgi:hypothetical protein